MYPFRLSALYKKRNDEIYMIIQYIDIYLVENAFKDKSE